MMLRILASRHAAFYSPLISTLAAGFLKDEGLEGSYGVLGPGQRSQTLLHEGAADIIQSAVSSNWKPMERGETPLPVHFAQINRRDGFFLVGRRPDSFAWKDLEDRTLVADHGFQPLTMLRYAATSNGVDWNRVRLINAGAPDAMAAAFRGGSGDYVHLQGPGAQQFEHIAASVGEAMPPVAFSSLCAAREFACTPACQAFLRAFGRAKQWVREASAEEVAAKQAPFFPGLDVNVLATAVRRYQKVGCWEGGTEIPRDLYEQALNVFEAAGAIADRHPYEAVCA